MVQERLLVILLLLICSPGIAKDSSEEVEQVTDQPDNNKDVPLFEPQISDEDAGPGNESQVIEQQSNLLESNESQQESYNTTEDIQKIEEDKEGDQQRKEIPTTLEQQQQTEEVTDSDTEQTPQPDYTSALRDLSEAVRSLLPLREHMAVAAECSEGREAAMQAVIAEMRRRMVQLERQISEAQDAERECQAEAQAIRAQGLESQIAECRGRLDEAHRPSSPTHSALFRVEIVPRSHENGEEDEASNVTSIQNLGQVLEQVGTKIVTLVSTLESKIGDIHSISKDTLKFVESVQENEQEDNTQSEEVAKLTDQLNASHATAALLRKQLEDAQLSCSKQEAQCNANITGAVNAQLQECESRVASSSAAARARCDAEAARMQGDRLGYIVSLHAEQEGTLNAVRNTCLLDKEKALAELNRTCQVEIEQITAQLATKEADCSEDCNSIGHHDVHEDKAQEQNVTLATMQANCDDALAAQQERCDSEIRLAHLQYASNSTDVSDHEILRQIDIRIQQETEQPSNTTMQVEDQECKGFSEASSHIIDPDENEVSIRLGRQLYIVGINKTNFESAKKACKKRGMWLLELDSTEELTDLIPRIQMLAGGESPEHSVWLSSRRASPEGWFRWECGGEKLKSPWGEPQLDNKPRQDCLVVLFQRQLGGHVEWRDVACDEAHQVVCEIKLEHD